jgi:hypothetical protein
MDMTTKTIENKALASLSAHAPNQVVNAIENASSKTGVNFAYLMQQASAESSFKPDAKAKTSSAAGLYQFIESTWLNMVDRYGEKHGLDVEGKSRKEILNLRYDPETASVMAAEFASENKQFLDLHWGGDVGSTELYFAHFMGAGGAASFLKSRDKNGLQPAAHLFPQAAKANYNVFYDSKTGRAKTLDEVYAFFDQKFQIEDGDLSPTGFSKSLVADSIVAADPAAPEQLRMYTSGLSQRNRQKLALAEESFKGSTGYQDILANPLDLILLTQLEMPTTDQNLEEKTFGRKPTIFYNS